LKICLKNFEFIKKLNKKGTYATLFPITSSINLTFVHSMNEVREVEVLTLYDDMGEVRTMITPIYGNEWPVAFEGTYIQSKTLWVRLDDTCMLACCAKIPQDFQPNRSIILSTLWRQYDRVSRILGFVYFLKFIFLKKIFCIYLLLEKLINRKYFPVKEKLGFVSRKVFF